VQTGASTHPIEPERDNSKPMAQTAASQLDRMLEDAEYLLNYAVEAGIEVEADIAKRIITAISVGPPVWKSPDAGELAAAITKLAAKLYPVTAETLRASRVDAHGAIRSYKRMAYVLAFFIIPLSIGSFICAAISNKIAADINRSNEYLLNLHTQLNAQKLPENEAPPPGILGELQKFGIEMRDIHSRTKQLNLFFPYIKEDPCKNEGTAPAAAHPAGVIRQKQNDSPTEAAAENHCDLELSASMLRTMKGLRTELDELTESYQYIRAYATSVTDDASLLWGAVGNFILPLLYALLGACAAVLRAFTQQLNTRTFAPSYATPARFVIAAIGGGVVGLFNNFLVGQNTSLSPLALAFLVGYAADIFFSFLEGATQNLGKAKPR
jgi:hypothetical protein